MPKTNRMKAVVVLEGGCVSDVLSLHPVEYEVWDWDDFNDNPIVYWQDREDKDVLKDVFDPEVYEDILKTLKEAEEEERDRIKSIPFHDVPNPDKKA